MLNRTTLAVPLALLAGTAGATTIVPIADAHLVDRSALIALVSIERESSPRLARPATDWTVSVDRVLKGFVGEGRIVVRLPGGLAANGMRNFFYGTPQFAPGRHALLFLSPRADGTFALADFPQGAFLAARAQRRTFAFRDFSEVRVLNRSGRVGSREPLRDLDRFADWIADRAGGFVRSPDYLVRPSRSELQSATAAFALFTNAGRNLRWFQFDPGGSVIWRSHTTPMPGVTGGGVNEFQRALAAWNNESSTPVRLAYAGTTGATGGFNTFDNVNAILWTDPNQEIAGTFDCASGGTLAVGGPWFDPDVTGVFNGKTFVRIAGGDVIMNDGVQCRKSLSVNFSKFIEEVTGHEIGHTLGLLHSSEQQFEPNALLKGALMYFRAKDNGKGAVLNGDDIAGLQFLYRKGGGGGGGTGSVGCPAGTPANTLCLLKGRFHVTGTWTNQFNNTNGTAIPIPNTDLAGFFYFSDKSNVELIIKILDFGTEIKVFYSQLTNLRFTLQVTDTSTGRTKSYSNTPGDCGAIDQNFATNSSSAIVDGMVANPEAITGTCSPTATTLCLLDKRFAVTVTWRNQFNGASGVGSQKTLSNLTGAFSFDSPANLEILIKTLEFPDKILVIYGSLSNFEYSIRVTDTSSGAVKTYNNAAGHYCGGLDDDAF